MSYRDPQLNVRSDAALYTNFFKSISDSFSKVATAYGASQAKMAALAEENKKANDVLDEKTEEYTAKLNAGIIKVDTSTQINLVESFKPVLDKLAEGYKKANSGNASPEEKQNFRLYEQKVLQSIGLAKNGLVAMTEKGAALVEAKENKTFDNTLNDYRDVFAFESINKGGVNKVTIDVEDPLNINWTVSTPSNEDNPEVKSTEIASFNFNDLLRTSSSDDTDYWTTIPNLEYTGVKEVLIDENNQFLQETPVKEVSRNIKSTDKKDVYQISQVVNFDEALKPGSALRLQLEADAGAYLAFPQEAASLWNNKLLPLDKTKNKWLGPLDGTPISKEQKAEFTELYIKSFSEGQGKTYTVKSRVEEVDKFTKPSGPRPGKQAAALLANINSLKNGQIGSTFSFKDRTATQTGENEWTVTEEVIDASGNASTKVIAKVDDPEKLKDKFGVVDAALVGEEADVNIDMAVDNALDAQ